jgi:polyhydroxybutyrate depolymerase
VVHLPPTYYDIDQQSVDYPLVIALHGTGGSAVQMEAMYGLSKKADESNFVVVYPDGVRTNGFLGIRTWNAGTCCDYAMENDIDDVAFISDLIDKLVGDFHVNPRRVYVTGMSNGGMMSYRIACELSLKIAAIAPVSSTMMAAHCAPQRPVPILHMHSVLDSKVPYNGGIGIGGYYFSAVDSVLTSWSIKNQCASTPLRVDNGQYIKTSWSNCTGNVCIESYVTYDGGHSWPGGEQAAYWADPPSAYVDANDLLWEFFQRFELP